MSRSYKHNPICKDWDRSKKFMKRVANKRVRRYKKNIPNGNWYRKIFESCDICDYYSMWTLQDAIEYNNIHYPEMSYQEIKDEWERQYYRK